MENIKNQLFSMQDLKYRDFTANLLPNIPKECIIGIRIPLLRKFALNLSVDEKQKVLDAKNHQYLEEKNLHAFLLEKIKDFDECISFVAAFLPQVDNWSTCDSLNPKVFAKNKEKLLQYIDLWLKSPREYTVRFAIKMLMTYYLGDDFKTEYAQRVADVERSEYYVLMMKAWYFATALAKNYDECVIFIENKSLDKFSHNKAIQKAVESYRVDNAHKEYLKKLKIR